MEFVFHNRFFRPALPPLRRALIQTGVSLCSVPKFVPPLFCKSRARRSSTTGNITDYFVRPRSPSRAAFPPFSARSGPDRGHKDADICDGHRDAITCAIRHAGPLPRRLRCTSRLRMSVCLAGACLRFSFSSPRAPLCLFLYPRPSSPASVPIGSTSELGASASLGASVMAPLGSTSASLGASVVVGSSVAAPLGSSSASLGASVVALGSGPWARGPRLWAWARGPRLWAWGPGLWTLGSGPWAWGPRLWALGPGP